MVSPYDPCPPGDFFCPLCGTIAKDENVEQKSARANGVLDAVDDCLTIICCKQCGFESYVVSPPKERLLAENHRLFYVIAELLAARKSEFHGWLSRRFQDVVNEIQSTMAKPKEAGR